MKKYLRTLSLTLAVFMLMSMFAFNAFAADTTSVPTGGDSGSAGDNCEWSWSGSDRVLRITGTGEMDYYDSTVKPAPWLVYSNEIEKIVVEDGVTGVGEYAFYNLKKLTAVELSDSVKTIGYYAFRNCTSLKSITLPSNLDSLMPFAFLGCKSLTEINISENSKYYTTSGNLYINNGKKCMVYYAPGKTAKSFSIPSGIVEVCAGAFCECTVLEKVTFPSGLKRIGDYAFEKCSSLKSLSFPSSVTTIDIGTFSGCKGLTSLTVPNTVTGIADDAFYQCTGIKTVKLGSGIKSISARSFYGCTALTSVTMSGNLTTIYANSFFDCKSLKSITLGLGLTKIREGAFENTGIKTVYIPKNVDSIGASAFGYTSDGINETRVTSAKLFCVKGTKADTAAKNYKSACGVPYTYVVVNSKSLNAGATAAVSVNASTATSYVSNKKSVAAVKNGKIYALKKGTATITAKLKDGSTVTGTVTVKTNPKLSKSSVTVKKGKTTTVKITGKCSLINNKYTNTKIAKITSKNTATTLTVKGLKIGTTTLKVNVNGVVLNLKVKVTK